MRSLISPALIIYKRIVRLLDIRDNKQEVASAKCTIRDDGAHFVTRPKDTFNLQKHPRAFVYQKCLSWKLDCLVPLVALPSQYPFRVVTLLDALPGS